MTWIYCQPRANRSQPLSLRGSVGETGVIGFTAAVSHPGDRRNDLYGIEHITLDDQAAMLS